MINITIKDVLAATGGKLLCGDENMKLGDIKTDTREIKTGDLFVPIIGKKVDAHIFVEQVLAEGVASFTSEHDEMQSDTACIRVDDTITALQQLGAYIRDRYDIPYIGITGSVGKTTTRQMIAAALGTAMHCFQTIDNKNSQVGVPVTLSQLSPEDEIAAIEMGISDPGNMEVLTRIVRPDKCVVTVIGVAHMETMFSKENIRKEKLSIINHMKEGGVLFLNNDDLMLREVKDEMPCQVVTFGLSEGSDFRGINMRLENGLTVFECVHGTDTVTVKLNALGRHNVRNALTGIAVAESYGIPIEVSSKAFEHFVGMRQNIIQMPDKYTIIDDTYNASPDSVKASIDVLCDIPCKGRLFVVLGDMLELGENSKYYHHQIGEYLRDRQIDEVLVIGEEAQEIKNVLEEYEDFYGDVYSFTDNGDIAIYLMAVMKPEDVVLIKGSNGMNLIEVVNILSN